MDINKKGFYLGPLFLIAIVMAYLTGQNAGQARAEHHWHLYCQSLGDIHTRTLSKMNIQQENRSFAEGVQCRLSLTDVLEELIRLNADIRLVVFGMEYYLNNQDATREDFMAEALAIQNNILADYRRQTQIFKTGKYRSDY